MELVVATRNRKKIEEIKRILEGVPAELFTLDDFPGCPEVLEDADSFRGNAMKKASAVAHFTRRPALSDDSGLEVYALHGAPGVLSARYAGEEADDRKNLAKLLTQMKDVEDSRRGARFVCCIALAFPDGKGEIFEGRAEGRIGRKPRGSNGFGYDPVFYPEGQERTFAEMTADEKDALSHRGMALRKFREYFAALARA
ncbi:MAG: XTP/dITP diphosphatase [Thermodesulfovibrionales bacterium]|jgi:XTP/dITP diphosphohydrolase